VQEPSGPPANRSTVPVQSPAAAVGVLLVRPDGSLLMQHRDARAPIGPNQWAFVAGALEPSELPSDAALRELREETGIQPETELELYFCGDRPRSVGDGTTKWHVYYAATNLTDSDVIVGEGREIRFVTPSELSTLKLTVSAQYFVSQFLGSTEYSRCVRQREQ
jgi:8-oxo-dGTP diphosphatase